MPLIDPSDMLYITDRLAYTWDTLLAAIGSKGNVTVGSVLAAAQNNLDYVVSASADIDIQNDLFGGMLKTYNNSNIEAVIANFTAASIDALNAHCLGQGSTVDASIVDFDTYFKYYQTNYPYENLLSSSWADLFGYIAGKEIYSKNIYGVAPKTMFNAIMTPAINPRTGYANGMGSRAVGGSFVSGQDLDKKRYVATAPLLVVKTTFSGGTGAAAFVVAGKDNTGAATTTWTATVDTNNPASTTTVYLDAAVAAGTYSAFNLLATPSGSGVTAGVNVGSELLVDAGSPTQETVVVENTQDAFSAVFRKDHDANAPITFPYSFVLVPSVSGRRLTQVTNITITTNGHSAGAVSVYAIVERVPIG